MSPTRIDLSPVNHRPTSFASVRVHIVRRQRPSRREVETQTVGLFYPGGKKVNQEQELMQEMINRELRMRDKQPPLTAVSPGRGEAPRKYRVVFLLFLFCL